MTTIIPVELITLMGSSFIGSIMRIWGQSMHIRTLQSLLPMHALGKGKDIMDARHYQNRSFQWTRRIIALTSVFFIIAFPKLVAFFHPEIPIYVGYPTGSKSFWIFSFHSSQIQWVQLIGITITPLDTHLLAAITGLYFGGALVGNY